jgi:hypothetical protein
MTNIPVYKKSWRSAIKFKPIQFDIVALQLADGRVIPGWWTGTSFDGRRLKEGDKVIAFRSYNGNSLTLRD